MAKKENIKPVVVIGAGLAGSEATYQLIRKGIPVILYEMRPKVKTGAHKTDLFAELVCSNSLGSNQPDRASGLLKEEMRAFGSFILDAAYKYRVPAGNALAVDRDAFAREITRYLKGHNLVKFINEEVDQLPSDCYVILASGPLTSNKLLSFLEQKFGQKHLYFFDAIAPIVSADSIDMNYAFKADRYTTAANESKGDYINCPLNKEEYYRFVNELLKAEQIELPEFEKEARKQFFPACQPIEQIAATGIESLRFGPLKPVGLIDPKTNKRPYAVLQLRADNLLMGLYNLVGCQTNLKYSEQERVFRLIPALHKAKFVRFGQMHKNIYFNSPKLLTKTLQLKNNPNWFIAGQITGVEGYTESAATGLIAGINCARLILGKPPIELPPKTMLGALINYITYHDHKNFSPMNANFALLANLYPNSHSDEEKKQQIILEARKALKQVISSL